MSLADVVLPRMREENEKLRADIERLQAESNISDALLADAKAEIEQLTEANRRMAKGCEEMGDEIGRLKAELAWYADHETWCKDVDGYGPTWGTGQW
jgi:hypothetical protein